MSFKRKPLPAFPLEPFEDDDDQTTERQGLEAAFPLTTRVRRPDSMVPVALSRTSRRHSVSVAELSFAAMGVALAIVAFTFARTRGSSAPPAPRAPNAIQVGVAAPVAPASAPASPDSCPSIATKPPIDVMSLPPAPPRPTPRPRR